MSIRYLIGDEEWTRTTGLRWKEDVFPAYDCFFGFVSFRVADEEVLGTARFDMSVADLAVGLAQVSGELRTGVCGVLKFQQSDDMLEILFQASRDFVTVSHNLAPDRSWTCHRSALEKAMVDFVMSFTNEVSGRVAELFDWRDMGILGLGYGKHLEKLSWAITYALRGQYNPSKKTAGSSPATP